MAAIIGMAAAVVTAAALWPGAAARAEEARVPSLWSEKERLPKPDLSGLERLRFLTTTDFPPFNYLDGGGRLSGFHVDLARAICAELAIPDKCQIQAMPWAELEPALNAGEGEAILAGIAVTPESRERLSFSRPYLRLPARLVMRRADATAATPVLDGRQVGVVAHSVHEGIARALFPKAAIVPFPQEEAMLAALRDGRLTAVFGDGMRLAAWLGRDGGACCGFAGGPYMLPQDLGGGLTVAVRHGNEQLAAAMDAALQQISAKGIFADLYLRTFPIGFY